MNGNATMQDQKSLEPPVFQLPISAEPRRQYRIAVFEVDGSVPVPGGLASIWVEDLTADAHKHVIQVIEQVLALTRTEVVTPARRGF